MKNCIFALFTVFIWSTMAAVVKLLLSGIPDFEALCISSLAAFLFMLLVNLFTGKLKTLKNYSAVDFLKMAALGFLGLFLYSALYYYGIALLSSQEACILNYLWPFFLLLFSAVILKEKLSFRKILAMLLSFSGIIILTLGKAGFSEQMNWTGVIVCVLAALCYGLFNVLNKICGYDQNISMTVIWLVTALFSGLAGLISKNWVPVTGFQWTGILWLGIVIDALAYYLWAVALNSSENSATIANLAYLTPFLSVLISALVLKEKIHFTAVIALVFITAGILVQNILFRKK